MPDHARHEGTQRGIGTDTGEVRCACHRLLARVDGERLALKCPRCKREALISLAQLAARRELAIQLGDTLSAASDPCVPRPTRAVLVEAHGCNPSHVLAPGGASRRRSPRS